MGKIVKNVWNFDYLFRFNFFVKVLSLSHKLSIEIRWAQTWPNLTRAYFWPAINKGPTHLWLGYFLTQADEIFFNLREKFGNFPDPEVAGPTGLDQTLSTKNDPDLPISFLKWCNLWMVLSFQRRNWWGWSPEEKRTRSRN